MNDADLMIAYYNLTPEGNWEPQKNIPHRKQSDEAFAKNNSLSVDELNQLVETANQKLLKAREKKVRPGLDDKILSGWNALMLKGLVDAYATFKEDKFLSMAINNANFIATKMAQGEGLFRTYKDGIASIDAYLEDYAAVIQAFSALYQITFDEQWLNKALSLTSYTITHFYDEEEKFFYFTNNKSERLIARKKELFDNVIPGSNSLMAQNLYALGTITSNSSYTKMATEMLGRVKKMLMVEPQYLTNWACLATQMVTPTAEIAMVGNDIQVQALNFFDQFLPNKILVGTSSQNESSLELLASRGKLNNETTFYVCFNKACQLPVNSPTEAIGLIEKGK